MDLAALLAEPLDGRFRAFGDTRGRATLASAGEQGWNVARGDLPLPLLVLDDAALEHNLRTMHGWCDERGLSLAPHGKTTMAPQLFRRQLAAGAWGMTAATVQQAAVMHAAGAQRVLLANELVGPAEVGWLARLQRDGLTAYVLVDSQRGVQLLDAALAAAGADRPLRVLLELGAPGTRAGCRSDDEARAVAAAVGAAAQLQLAGVEAWEGAVGHDREPATLAAVDALLERAVALARSLDAGGSFAGCDEILLSAGGSTFFDRVAERLRVEDGGLSRPVRTVVRSGCYLTHDHGHYDRISPLGERLRKALQLWADVRSIPEPGLAIVGFGKRDAPYDIDLPPVLAVVDAGGRRRSPPPGAHIAQTNDQHAFLRFEGDELEVGDVVVCGISHPCTAFDKWNALPLLDADANVIGAIRTVF